MNPNFVSEDKQNTKLKTMIIKKRVGVITKTKLTPGAVIVFNAQAYLNTGVVKHAAREPEGSRPCLQSSLGTTECNAIGIAIVKINPAKHRSGCEQKQDKKRIKNVQV